MWRTNSISLSSTSPKLSNFHLFVVILITIVRSGCWTSTSDRRPRTRCRRGWRTCSPSWCPGSCSWRGLSTPQSESVNVRHLRLWPKTGETVASAKILDTTNRHKLLQSDASNICLCQNKLQLCKDTVIVQAWERRRLAGTAQSLKTSPSRSQMQPIFWTIIPRQPSE